MVKINSEKSTYKEKITVSRKCKLKKPESSTQKLSEKLRSLNDTIYRLLKLQKYTAVFDGWLVGWLVAGVL